MVHSCFYQVERDRKIVLKKENFFNSFQSQVSVAFNLQSDERKVKIYYIDTILCDFKGKKNDKCKVKENVRRFFMYKFKNSISTKKKKIIF